MKNEASDEEIFSSAMRLEPEERSAFLHDACGDDTERIERIQSLIRANEQSDGFLEHTGDGDFPIADAIREASWKQENSGDMISRYRLLDIIGEGSWGIVWMAEQLEPIRRRVAIKILKLGMDSKEVLARFESERQALALMDHPHIAKVLDGGITDKGRSYFVMELVRGPRLTDYCDEERLSISDRLDLFIKLCEAVQHAHQKGIIHRDLKPSNILVNTQDGMASPKVIDFGVAKAADLKLTEHTFFTRFQSFIGTPAYSSPEQMQMRVSDVDTRSDTYGLGAVLYHLLVGHPPFDSSLLDTMGIDAMRKKIAQEDPPRPSAFLAALPPEELKEIAVARGSEPDRLAKRIKGDLDWICMKCLEKNRSRRYETVNALAMDIRRHLNGEPVLAHDSSIAYKVGKLLKRNRMAFGVTAALVITLIAGSVISFTMAIRATKAENLAQREALKSRELSDFFKNLFSHIDSVVELRAADTDTQLLKDTLNLARRRLGSDWETSFETRIEARDILGSMYFKIREYELAEAMFRDELALLRNNPDTNYEYLAQALNHLGAAQGRQGKLEQAEMNVREAVDIHLNHLSDTSRALARTLVNLGAIEVKKAREFEVYEGDKLVYLGDARQMLERALQIQKSLLGDEHVEIAATLNELGFVLAVQKEPDLELAESILREALAMNRKLLGNEHPAVAGSLNLLAIVLATQSNYDEALQRYNEVRLIRQSLESHPSDLMNTSAVATFEHQDTGTETLQALQDIIDFSIKRYDPNSIQVADLLAIRSYVLYHESKFKEAEIQARRCIDIRNRLIPNHWKAYYAKSLLGSALFGQQRFEEAERYLIEGYQGVFERRDTLTSEHRLRLDETFSRIVLLYKTWGRPDELARWMQEAEKWGLQLIAPGE